MLKTILAIEDDPQIAELLELLLDSPDLRMLNYTSGKEGFEAVLHHRPALVLLDVKLPEMTGWEVLEAMRQHEAAKEIPVIMLSVSQPEFERRELFSRSKINFYMAKPFDILALRRKIREILDVHTWQVSETPTQPKPPGGLRNITDKLFEVPKPAEKKE